MSTPGSAMRRGRLDLDALAMLEEQRDFLLRSLDDLDAERGRGDLGEGDFETLRDDYTRRAAEVLRAIEEGHGKLAQAPPRSRLRTALVIVAVVLLAVGAGVAAAVSSGTRRPGEVATGGVVDRQIGRMAEAAKLANEGRQLEALKLYDRILADEPDHVAALTERGLLLGVLGRSAERDALIEEGRVSLERALALKPKDPRALFYRGLVLRFLGEDESALDSFRAALAADPPPDLRSSIEGFLATAGAGQVPVPSP
ncbi:MAG: hypothetical protein HYR89_11685 [Actinobacteria bacterium]|nr:hypothetical protein [Actinomycetota bacterium]